MRLVNCPNAAGMGPLRRLPFRSSLVTLPSSSVVTPCQFSSSVFHLSLILQLAPPVASYSASSAVRSVPVGTAACRAQRQHQEHQAEQYPAEQNPEAHSPAPPLGLLAAEKYTGGGSVAPCRLGPGALCSNGSSLILPPLLSIYAVRFLAELGSPTAVRDICPYKIIEIWEAGRKKWERLQPPRSQA